MSSYMKPHFVVEAVDLSDCSLQGAANALQEALDRMSPLSSVQILPCRTSYSLGDPDNLLRDYHYTETGYLIVGTRRTMKGKTDAV